MIGKGINSIIYNKGRFLFAPLLLLAPMFLSSCEWANAGDIAARDEAGKHSIVNIQF